MENIVYYVGLIFATLIIIFSLDDVIWDLIYMYYSLSGKLKEKKISVKNLEKVTPKLLAVVVAAYKEEDVLEQVIENLVRTQEYPMSLYHIFLGVYPNDPGTKEIALNLSKRYPNIHVITHVLNGPSSKADNINNVIKNIFEYEKIKKFRFNGIIIHDSEDIVHPYEFMLENYLFETKEAIQIPVFPLQEMPKWSNFFKNMVTGTYADEFAENHFRTLNARNAMNAFVPSAGTGFALRRDVLDSFKDHNIFPVGSLTEDFKLSLQLKEKGFDVYYPLEKVYRLNYKKEEKKEYIATRSMFPKTFKAAVRQKTRWTYGITMQTFKMKDILKSKNLSFKSKYSLFKDWKVKYTNLLIIPGYVVFIYFLLSLFLDIPTMYGKGTLSWYLMIFLTLLMVEKQILRFVAVKNVYGLKSAFISGFTPPILPIRMVVGNFINFHATVKAWNMNFLANKKKNHKDIKETKDKIQINKTIQKENSKKKNPGWSKTDHEFLSPNILKRFYRNLGDDLLKKEIINLEELSKGLSCAEKNNIKLGEALVQMKLVSEKQIVESIALGNHSQYINQKIGEFPEKIKELYDLELLKDLNVVPLFNEKDMLTLLATIDVDKSKLERIFKKEVDIVYTLKDKIDLNLYGVKRKYKADEKLYIIQDIINEGYIKVRHGIIALRYTADDGDIIEKLKEMGFLHKK